MAQAAMTALPGAPLKGAAKAPGDKSISHRALILGAMASGLTEIHGLLEGEDVRRTAGAMARLRRRRRAAGGGPLAGRGPGRSRRTGRCHRLRQRRHRRAADHGRGGGLRPHRDLHRRRLPARPADEPGDGAAGPDGRPLRRPLGRPPAAEPLGRRTWRRSAYRLPNPSAQVKSAILLAGLNARGETRVIEPELTRDHTERMLRAFGAEVGVEDGAEGRTITSSRRSGLARRDDHGSGRSVVGGLPPGGGPDHPGFGGHGGGRAGEPSARRALRDAQGNGRRSDHRQPARGRRRAGGRYHRPGLLPHRRHRAAGARGLDDRRISDPGRGRRLRPRARR